MGGGRSAGRTAKMSDLEYGRSLVPFGKLMGTVWLAFLAYPVFGLLRSDLSPAWLAAAVTGLSIFVVLYLRLVFSGPLLRASAEDIRSRRIGLACLVALALALNLVFGEGGYWLGLFLFCSAVTVVALPAKTAVAVVAGVTATTAAVGWAVEAGAVDTGTLALLAGLIGISQIGYARLLLTVAELRAAREELARLAVSEERLRFARDLHDLLGHSLSLITLKSELAGRLLPDAPEKAADEVRDVERVAREALREVRAAVSGYRAPTLSSELAGAREMLSAAGIRCRIEKEAGHLAPSVDAVLAWTVREGVTNVIRHSRARNCEIRIRQEAGAVHAEVLDDGRGPDEDGTDPSPAGSGLSGLAERVAASDGRLETCPNPAGGFRLAVALPVDADSEAPAVAPGGGVGGTGR